LAVYDDVKTFFLTYIKNYGPYEKSGPYKVFVDFLIESFLKDSYDVIPADFKSAYEDQVLPDNFVTPFLRSVGLTTDIISQLSTTHRRQFATFMGNFHRFKGTVQLVDNLMTNFASNDAISVYELWLNNVNGTWEVLPKLISKSSLASTHTVKPKPLSFLQQYDHWFIDEATLNNMYAADEIELPYKTNCIYVDGTVQEDMRLIIGVVAALVRGSFGSESLQLTFKDSAYLTTFDKSFQLWFYVLRKIANSGTNTLPFTTHDILDPTLVYNTYEIPVKLNNTLPRGKINIQTIIDEYDGYVNNTSTDTITTDIWTFFKNKINIFNGPVTSSTTTFDQYRASISSTLGSSLIEYIDTRLTSASNMSLEGQTILSEIYNSFLVFKNITTSALDTSYVDYLLLTLPGFSKELTTTPFYILLKFLKPYHCDIYSTQLHNITSNSLFDNGLVAYTSSFAFHCEKVSYESISDKSSYKQTFPPIYDNEVIASVTSSMNGYSTKNMAYTITDNSGPYTYYNPNTNTTTVYTT